MQTETQARRRTLIELVLAPYAESRGPVFSVQLWDTMQAPDHYPFTGMVRFGYRLSMDGQLVVEGEDYMVARAVAADKVRALGSFVDFFTDEGFVQQLAEELGLRAATVEERDQYLCTLAYLPHCEALRREALTVLSDV